MSVQCEGKTSMRGAGQGWSFEWTQTWRTLEKLEIIGPGQPGLALIISSANTRLHFLENSEERMSPSFPAFLRPSPAPLVCCMLPGLAAGTCEVSTKLLCAEGLLTSGWLIPIMTLLVTQPVRFR